MLHIDHCATVALREELEWYQVKSYRNVNSQYIFSNLGGYLSGKGRVSLLNVDCTLEGEFVKGKLHGPVRGLTTKGTKV